MRKILSYSAAFIGVYLLFAIYLLPASVFIDRSKLPNNIQLGAVTGTVWQANIDQLIINKLTFYNFNAKLGLWSLVTLEPQIFVTFGDKLLPGPEGRVAISGLMADLKLFDLQVEIAANDLVQQYPLPIEVVGHDYLTINMPEFVMGKPVCQQLMGNVAWDKAAISAFEQKVKLGKLGASLTCDNGQAIVDIKAPNDLGLTMEISVGQGYRISGQGYLKPNANTPKEIEQILPFLGKPDNQGRYRLRF